MDANRGPEATPGKNRATVERTSDRELVVTRMIDGPARLVFEAFTRSDLLKRWWAPKASPVPLLSFDTDCRVGGRYRVVWDLGDSKTMEFFGKYLEVTPPSRLVWTNEEGEEGATITTVTFEALGERTRVVMHDLYPSKEALDAAMEGDVEGMEGGMAETLGQLNELIVELLQHPDAR